MHDIRPHIPEPFEKPGTLLYIGARLDACAWLTELADAGNEITLLEIWPKNARDFTGDPRLCNIVLGDVRALPISDGFDYVWWWHGPEHVEQKEFPHVIERLLAITHQLLAVAAPWGRYPQGVYQGNPTEQHYWSVYRPSLRRLGMETATDGRANTPGSEIVGWIRK